MIQTRHLSMILFALGLFSWGTFALAQEGQNLYSSDFSSGIDPRLMVQAPTPESMQVVSTAHGRVLKVSINQTDDYSRVANGVPRAELSFGGVCRFAKGKEYLIRWSTLLPEDFDFDTLQPEGISQIHEGAPAGSPPFGLSLNGSKYEVRLQGNGRTVIGDATGDRGRWVQWSLRYRPDDTGSSAITELYKDNQIVFNADGIQNAWPNDDRSYFKMGIYKWWWQSHPTSTAVRTIFFGDVKIAQR